MGVANFVVISGVVSQRVTVRWYFAGFDSPALDIRVDETPPTSQGAFVLPILVRTGENVETPAEQEAVFRREIEQRYIDQGITARDVTRMVGEDILRGATIGEIRDRDNESVPQGSRGTLSNLQVVRTVNNDCVPIETPI